MTQQRGKKIGLPHPAVTFAAAGLLLGVTFNEMIRPAPRTSGASGPPGGLPPVAAAPPAARSGMAASFAGPPAPALPAGGDEPRTPGADLPALLPAPPSAATSPPALVGPPAPARGPDWKRAPLPAVSPEVLQAMLNPRAVRRARHLRRLGLVPPPEPASPQEGSLAMAQHRIAGPAHPKGAAAAAAAPVPRPVGSHPPSGYAAAGAEAPAPTAITKRERPEPASHESGSLTPASPATPADPGGKSAAAQPTGASGSTPHEAKPDGESGGKEAAADGRTAAPAADRAPIRLRARLNHPRSEYRVGEWVAVRFLASQPVHLRVYRVDAAGHVTCVFSTYGRDNRGSPARTFSMMVKAGEPQPGQEGMVAIGSARPLTRDELLACLRAYLAEGPADSAASTGPAVAPAAVPKGGAADVPPFADVLQTVIDAVGRTTDTPDAPAAPLDRSAWSIAVGRFVSAERKLSAVSGQRSVKEASDRSEDLVQAR